jgi:hypothetical protein
MALAAVLTVQTGDDLWNVSAADSENGNPTCSPSPAFPSSDAMSVRPMRTIRRSTARGFGSAPPRVVGRLARGDASGSALARRGRCFTVPETAAPPGLPRPGGPSVEAFHESSRPMGRPAATVHFGPAGKP